MTVGGLLFGWLILVLFFFLHSCARFKGMGRAAGLDQKYTGLQTPVFPLNPRRWFLEQDANTGSRDGSLM